MGTLSQPFPHTKAFNPANGLPEPPDEDDFESNDYFNAAEDAYRPAEGQHPGVQESRSVAGHDSFDLAQILAQKVVVGDGEVTIG